MSMHRSLKWTGLGLGLAAALTVAALLSPFASRKPDGLDRVAEDHGLSGRAKPRAGAPMPDYRIAGVKHPGLSTSLAGVAGTLLTFGAGWGLSLLLQRRKPVVSRPERQTWESR